MSHRIITVSRQFGSGGREVGKRLAEALGVAYYDREIITAVAQRSGLAEEYIASISERGVNTYYPITFGHTFSYSTGLVDPHVEVMSEQNKLLKSLAEKGDCLIVGRCADVVLREHTPFNLFIYADQDSKLKRCRSRQSEEEKQLSDNELKRRMAKVDKDRSRYRALLTDIRWGDPAAYHLCVNTTGWDMAKLVESLVPLAQGWFDREGK